VSGGAAALRGGLVIAIDGAAGSGKSTLARAIADALGLPYLNTGLMYRALTLEALRRGVSPDDAEGLVSLMRGLTFALERAPGASLTIGGSQPEPELEASAVDGAVSSVSRHPAVRELMRIRQRALGEAGAVVEGRDIGSVVFPDAPVKLYLIADAGARAARRARQRSVDTGATAVTLHARDAADSAVNPFEPAADAVVIDTGRLDRSAALEAALTAIRGRTGAAP
jgi:cytidylate kinase